MAKIDITINLEGIPQSFEEWEGGEVESNVSINIDGNTDVDSVTTPQLAAVLYAMLSSLNLSQEQTGLILDFLATALLDTPAGTVIQAIEESVAEQIDEVNDD